MAKARIGVIVASMLLAGILVLSSIPSEGWAQQVTLQPWNETIDYGAASGSSGTGGLSVEAQSCVGYNGYVYCVGGYLAGNDTSRVFFAKVTAAGVGPWTETTDYGAASGNSGTGGTAAEGLSCVEDSGYIYCIGGLSAAVNEYAYSSKVFYAKLSASGVGPWSETTDYGASAGTDGTGGLQIRMPSCVTSGGYVYCVGGVMLQEHPAISRVYYAKLSSTGVGPWTETTDYGASSGDTGSGGLADGWPACVSVQGHAICLGGNVESVTRGVYYSISDVFYAALGPGGVGPWIETTDYGAASGSSGAGGTPVEGEACVSYNWTILCSGDAQPSGAVEEGMFTRAGDLGSLQFSLGKPLAYGVYSHSMVYLNSTARTGTSTSSSVPVFIVIGGRTTWGGLNSTSAVWYSQPAGSTVTTTATSSSLTSSAASTPSTSSTTGKSTLTSATTTTGPTPSSIGGDGGIPEFPPQFLAVAVFAAVLVVAFLLLNKNRSRRPM